MITADETVFPQNIVKTIAEHARQIDEDITIVKRRLRNTDPAQSLGVYGVQWNPDTDSFEMRGGPAPGPSEPTLQTYTVGLQAFVKDTDEERGLAVHSVFAKRIRTMLYRDAALRVAFASLESTAGGSKEVARRWGVRQQRLISNEINGTWLYLSTLEFWLDTQTM